MTTRPTIYLPPSFLHFVPRYRALSTWAHHLPFGYDLVAALRPRVITELGTYSGLSYFCFCQSLDDHNIDGVCYAVDTWQGDEHTGPYTEDVYRQVLRHSREYYSGNSYLMRMTFGEAAAHFSEESIDLLHIDGLHTYAAVSEDFETWYPKVRPGGIVLFHDIYARMKDFGVWKFWEETSPQFETCEFKHGYGLGVLRKPGGSEPQEPLLQMLFSGVEDDHARLRSFYVETSQHVTWRTQHSRGETPGLGFQGKRGGRQAGPPGSEPAAPQRRAG